jgi:SAM-dependent methyltransferase
LGKKESMPEMQADYAERYYAGEPNLWWTRGRRDLLVRLVEKHLPDRAAALLDIGCGGGTLVGDLKARGYARVRGVDLNNVAVATAHTRGHTEVVQGDASAMPIESASCDAVIASDVLDCADHPVETLAECHRVLKPGGWLFVLTPAHTWLAGQIDIAANVIHRFGRTELREALEGAGFVPRQWGYWNGHLFPPVAALRIVQRFIPAVARAHAEDLRLFKLPQPVSEYLFSLLKRENDRILAGDDPRIGVSAYCFAQKPDRPR